MSLFGIIGLPFVILKCYAIATGCAMVYKRNDMAECVYVKYMVSLRCKLLVKQELAALKISYRSVELGVVELDEALSSDMSALLKERLQLWGLTLLDDRKSILIEKIKVAIIDMVHHADDLPEVNYSAYLSDKIGYNYTYLANIFSEVKGITIRQFIIVNKIERAKELLLYDELSLTEIAYKLHYSSVAHLSAQFKKVTGLTPSFFKKIGARKRAELENV